MQFLIVSASRWVLDSFPHDGLQIFTDSNPECEKLPIQKVMKYLKEINNKLAIQYLEHVVNTRDIKKQQYHNNLALFYKVVSTTNTFENPLKTRTQFVSGNDIHSRRYVRLWFRKLVKLVFVS